MNTLFINIVLVLVGFFTIRLMTESFGLGEYGEITLTFIIGGLVETVLVTPIGQLAFQTLKKPDLQGGNVYTFMRKLSVFFGLGGVLLLMPAYMYTESTPFLYLMFIFLFLNIDIKRVWIANTLHYYGENVKYTALISIPQIAIFISASCFYLFDVGALGVPGFIVLYFLIRIVLTFFLVMNHKEGAGAGAGADIARGIKDFVIPMSKSGALGWVGSNIERIILIQFMSKSALGEYAACSAPVTRGMGVLGAVLSTLLKPKVYSDINHKHSIYWAMSIVCVFFAGLVFINFLGEIIVTLLFSEEYRGNAVVVMNASLFYMSSLLLSHVVENSIIKFKGPSSLIVPQVVVFFVFIPIYVIIIENINWIFIVYAKAAAEAVKSIWFIVILRNKGSYE